MVEHIPGFESLRRKYLVLLIERRDLISRHLKSVQGNDVAADQTHLAHAHGLLHQISGNAGSFGYANLGNAARACDNFVTAHLDEENHPRLSPKDLNVLHKKLSIFEAECAIALATADS